MASPSSLRPRHGEDSSAYQSDTDFTLSSRKHANAVHGLQKPSTPLWQIRVNSNLSTHFICSVRDKFTADQVDLIRKAGFSVVLYYSANYKFDRHFAVWMLAHLRYIKDYLVLHGHVLGDSGEARRFQEPGQFLLNKNI
jgi:hypothetical protein